MSGYGLSEVAEEEERPMARFGEQGLELVEVLKMGEVWMHPGPSCQMR